jgi:formylglycine-generating enzyme required for sulfatase activity
MGDERGRDHEKPVHLVQLADFAIGRTPVTWGEYKRFCERLDRHWPEWLEPGSDYHLEYGNNTYYSERGIARDALDLPVVGISWHDALAYCEWLSEQTGERYRLPTEAEWEYACRAGTETRWSCGDAERDLEKYAWYSTNSGGKLQPVATKRLNPWGLHDMHGNVREWCADWYSERYYQQLASALEQTTSRLEQRAAATGESPSGTGADASSAREIASGAPVATSGLRMDASENPSGPESGSARVVRGGAWNYDAGNCRSAYRNNRHPSIRSDGLGFRLLRTV